MLYSRDGKIATREGKVLERKNNILTFQVQGSTFPDPSATNGQFELNFSEPQTVLVNYGDGSTVEYQSKGSSNYIQIMNPQSTVNPDQYSHHVYSDGLTGTRFISMLFEDLKTLKFISFFFCQIEGVFPININSASNLESLYLQSTNNLERFPASISQNKNIKFLGLGRAFSQRLNQIPDGFFEMSLEELIIGNAAVLTDLIASNFFKINQLKNTLKRLVIRNNFVETLPDSIEECINLEIIDAYNNPLLEFPKQIAFLTGLVTLRLGKNITSSNNSIPVLFNQNLEDFDVRIESLNFSDIPLSFKNLKSLRIINAFDQLVINDTRFDEFIDEFYTLTIENAYLDPATAPPEETFPNQFRNVTWGDSSLTPTGTIQAPAIDGDPQTQGEKIHELVNKYGHIITTA